jgi:transposase
VPALPSCLIEPVWDQFAAVLPVREDTHPLGCHRRRIPDRVIFDKLVELLVFGCAYHRIADGTCSATTLRRRRDEWIAAGVMETLHTLVLVAYDRMIGLELTDLAVDGYMTTAPCGGDVAGRSPVNRGKQGRKRSLVVDAKGIPLGVIAAPASRPDSPLLEPTLDRLGPRPTAITVHLDRGYDSGVTRQRLAVRGMGARLRPAAHRPRSRPGSAGSWNEPMPGPMPSRRWSGAPNAGPRSSPSGLPFRPPSSSSGG